MSRRRLILHIGLHKTGTSYLQKLFLRNRERLASESVGLAMPIHEERGDHHLLVSHLDAGPEGYANFLAGLQTGCDTTLVTSECFTPWLLCSDRAGDLRSLLEPLFDVTVVLYLRRQDYLKESVFAEVATSWYQGDILDENHYLYDLEAIVDRVVEVFGAAALRLGIYRDDVPQDIVGDFLGLCGLDRLAGRLGAIPRERVSLDRRVVALLARCPKEDQELIERIRSAVIAADSIAADPCKYQLSPEQRRAFLEPYIESNRRVARKYRPDAEAYLTAQHPASEHWRPIEPFAMDEVASLLVSVARQPSAASIEPIGTAPR